MGVYTSSILSNNVLLFNGIYKQVYTMLENNSVLDEAQIKEAKDLLSSNEYKHNPDFLHLEALLYMKIGDLQKSKNIFDEAYKLFDEKKSPMNNTSVFLKNYINIFRLIQ